MYNKYKQEKNKRIQRITENQKIFVRIFLTRNVN